MEALFVTTTGILAASGLYLRHADVLSRRRRPDVTSYAVNLSLFSTGGLTTDGAAVINDSGGYTDPLPQALVLTAIVIGFAMTAFSVILAMRVRGDVGSDHVNGNRIDEPREDKS